jgi:hypothetical protein
LKNSFLLFFISPFIGLIQGFKNYRESWAKNSVWLFVVFYGFTMSKPEAMDSSRYVTQLNKLYSSSVSWDVLSKTFYSDEGESTDIYHIIVTYFLSFFTNNGNILFATFGIVFGYFYSRNIWLIFDLVKKDKINIYLFLLIFCFASIIGFWELNGVRMWTAAHIFFYGTILYFLNGNKNGLLIAASSILVHFSYLLPVTILGFFLIVKIPWKILYYLFLASFSISELNLASVSEKLTSIAPAFLLPKVTSYTGEAYAETVKEMGLGNWYFEYSGKSLGWFILIMFTIIYFSKSPIKSSKFFYNLFGFTLLFLSISNVMSLIPSGGRYILISRLFALTLLILFYIQSNNIKYKRWLSYLSPILLLFIVFSIRKSFDTVSFSTLFTNPIIALFINAPIPLIDLIK